jgi:cellulose synthase/poly-beta-1,6-N-acetylglucosamine synthase-like glycosyltransferase
MQWLALILLIPYIHSLLRIFSGLKKISSFSPGCTPEIFVSVIVACRNEEKNLVLLLSDIASQDYDQNLFELVIIDDNSSDSTYEIASGYNRIKNIKVLKNPESGKKKAIKSGVEASTGELVITTDADCRAGRSWLKNIVSFYAEYKPEMIIGPVVMRGSDGFFQHFQLLEFMSLQGITAGTAMNGSAVMCNGANLAFTRESYQSHEENMHYDKISGDDVFLLHSLKRKKENKIMWLESEDSVVTTFTLETINSFFRQRTRWISKAGSYRDLRTVYLGIVTVVAIILQPLLLAAGIFDPQFLLVLLAAFILKSIPDYMILQSTTSRYGNSELMKWFLPSQICYTFYILRLIPEALFRGNRWD